MQGTLNGATHAVADDATVASPASVEIDEEVVPRRRCASASSPLDGTFV